jgi:uncharacterized protein (DUF2062 family)
MAILKVQPAMTAGPFFESQQTINANVTLTTGNNAISVGPVVIANGITVVIPSGSRWLIM